MAEEKRFVVGMLPNQMPDVRLRGQSFGGLIFISLAKIEKHRLVHERVAPTFEISNFLDSALDHAWGSPAPGCSTSTWM